jgi:hypothetical protein
MKKNLLVSMLCVLGLAYTGCDSSFTPSLSSQSSSQPSTSQGQEVKSEAGKFTVVSPVSLKETPETVDTPAGKVNAYMFSGEREGKALFAIVYADYPETMVTSSNRDKIVESAARGAVSNVNGKLIASNKVSVSGNPGREVVAQIKSGNGQEGTLKSRVFLVKNRLYQVMTIAAQSEAGSAELDNFLTSFKLTDAK